MNRKSSNIEYMCTWCGKKEVRTMSGGRPMPGICPKRPKMSNGQGKPHTWVINKRF